MLSWVLSSSTLILVILILRRILRSKLDPRLTYALWLLAALRILIPVSFFSLPVSVASLADESGLTGAVEDVRYTTEYETTYGSVGDSYSEEDVLSLEDTPWFQEADWFGHPGITDVHIVDAQEVTAAEAGGNPESDSAYARLELEITRDRFFILRVIWYAGMAVMALWFLFTNLRFHLRLHQNALPVGVDSPLPVQVMPNLVSPCLYGLLRPAIYVTPDCLTDEARLHHVLTHETVHYRHGDHWWAAVRVLCLCVQWFNPLVWVAAWASRRDCELACDASAIRILGEEQRLSYGKTLVDMIAAGRYPGAFLHTATTMTSGKTGIAQRIQLIAKRPKMTAVTLISVLLIAALTAACAFGGAAQREDTPAPEEHVVPPQSEAAESSVPLPEDPAELAQTVYSAIVGDGSHRDFYLEITDGPEGSSTTTRIHMTEENTWNLHDDVSRYQWAYAVSDGSEASLPITLSTPDGSLRLRCWADSNRVIIEKDGNMYFLTAREPDNQDLVVRLHYSLLQAANDALITEAHSSIVIDGSLTDYEAVAEEYARRYAANLNALPDWVSDKPGETVYRTSGVSQAYFGEGTENFCAFFGLYLSPEMGNSTWQAGSGMDEETEGEYAGWWMWTMGADFARSADGDWVCTGMYTGGEMLEFPTPPEEATMAQLVHYFYYTSGMNHDYLIPYVICRQPAASADDLNQLLTEYDDPAALCIALGAFLRDYGEYEDIQLTYAVLSQTLDTVYAARLTEGYTSTP